MAKILIVDDSRTSRKILRTILESAGHEVVGEAVDGVDGVNKFRELSPEITTLDITMPNMDGLEALKEIKKTFIVHGESDAQEAMKGHLYEAGFRNIHIPQIGIY